VFEVIKMIAMGVAMLLGCAFLYAAYQVSVAIAIWGLVWVLQQPLALGVLIGAILFGGYHWVKADL
jgi:hypothetical protein